jgi:hypothetical protein
MPTRFTNEGLHGRVGWLRRTSNLPLLAYRALRWRTGHWLGDYLLHHRPFDPSAIPPETPIDIMVLIVDHFEPAEDATPEEAAQSVQAWCQAYEGIAQPYRDADGRYPQHSWFYPAENPNFEALQVLSDFTFRGFGEVDFHLHHGFDTHESFAEKLRSGLDWFNQSGAMLTAEEQPSRRFAYIAGNWALDNGAGDDATSGCDTELIALREAGCYADFTFPALGSPAQPRKTNAIYYAADTPEPKSYDTGEDVAVGRPSSGDLMIFQGPLLPDWHSGKIEDGALEFEALPTPARLNAWLRANIHVKGRPEWLFVKLHTHGMQTRDMFLGPAVADMFAMMCARWNEPPVRLHFVTAREAYNIAKAAEAGLRGNPNDYRDYLVPPPANRLIRSDRPWRLLHYGPGRVCLELQTRCLAKIDFAAGPLRSVRGTIERMDARFEEGLISSLEIEGDGEFDVQASQGLPGKAIPSLR